MCGIRIAFQGDPVAQQRCRIFKRGNRVCSFDPQVMCKKSLKQLAEDQVHEHSLANEPWKLPEYPRVVFWFMMPIPKSMGKTDRALAERDILKHVKKPDVDNLIKLYLDVLTGPVLKDDNCVQIDKAIKIYSLNPRTIIFIQESGKTVTNEELYGGK